MLVSYSITLGQRRVVLESEDDMEELPPGLPEEWKYKTYVFTMQARDGLQEVMGQVQVLDTEQRHALIIVPKGALTGDPTTWPTLNMLGYDRTIGGVEVLNPNCGELDQCNPNEVGFHNVSGVTEPPARVFWIAGEDKDDVKKWAGSPGWPYLWWP